MNRRAGRPRRPARAPCLPLPSESEDDPGLPRRQARSSALRSLEAGREQGEKSTREWNREREAQHGRLAAHPILGLAASRAVLVVKAASKLFEVDRWVAGAVTPCPRQIRCGGREPALAGAGGRPAPCR